MTIDEAKVQSMLFDASRNFEITEAASQDLLAATRDGHWMGGDEFGAIITAITECEHCAGLAAQLMAHYISHDTFDGDEDGQVAR